jgi:hypothetical protein
MAQDKPPVETLYLHLSCTPWLTWCYRNTRPLFTTSSIRAFLALPAGQQCPDCTRAYHGWLDVRRPQG